MAEFIEFKQPISVASTIMVDGVELGLNAYTDTTIPTNNNTLTNGAGYITSSSTNTLTNKSGNISQWTNNSGYITSYVNTTYTAGSGLALTGTVFSNTAPNVVQTTVSGNAGSATVLQTARNIAGVSFDGSANISLDNKNITNGAGYTTNTGTVTSVGISHAGDAFTAGSAVTTSGTLAITMAGTAAQYVNGLGNLISFPSIPQGDITSVGAGTGMTGGGTSGAVTLNVIGGTGITANADNITIDATVATLSGTQTFTNKSGAISQWTNDSGYTTLAIGTTATTAKAGNITTITSAQSSAITANTAKVGITTTQASDITANNAKVSDTGTPAMLSNGTVPSLNTGITAAEVRSLIGAGTSSSTGTVTSVGGTGTVSGLTLSGTVTSTGNLTLGGKLVLASSDVTAGLGFTPYNATNPAGYTSLAIGTTATTAKAGNTTTITGAQATAITNNSAKVSDTGTPAMLSNGTAPSLNTGISAAEVRSLIGAGTSSLAIGTTASTAMAGNTTTITGAQATAIVDNSKKVTDTGTPAILSNGTTPTLNSGISAAEVRTLIGAGTSSSAGVTSVSGTANRISVTAGATPTVNAITGAVNSSSANLATGAQIQTAIDSAVTGVLKYMGTWDAATNVPTLTSAVGTPGEYYIVSTAGSTNLDGITDWAVGDWAVFSDQVKDAWQKIDNTQVGNVTGSGSNTRVAFWNSASNLTSDAGMVYNAASNHLTITGNYYASGGNSAEWNQAYDNYITGISDSGTSTTTITLTQRDGGTISTAFSNPQGTTTPSNTQTFTNKSGAISQWTNDSGYKTTDNNTTYSAGSGITLTGTVFSNAAPNVVQTTITGNAGSATKLLNARTISGVSFNGTANITLNNSNITNGAGYTTNTGTTTPSNVQTFTNKGGNISQWTNDSGYITSYVNTTYTAGTGLKLTGTVFSNTAPNVVQTTISGNAGSATVLQNARTIAGVSFNGSANISLNNNAITNGAGYITSYVNTTYSAGAGLALTGTVFSNTNIITDNKQLLNGAGYTTNTGTTTPSNTQTFTNKSGNISQWTNDSGYKTTDNNTTYTAGSGITLTGTVFSNAAPNVVQTTISGNAGSATKLQTARTIAGVSFDGTANIGLNNANITNGAGYTTNTGTVTGTVSASESNNTIAQRTSNGYLHASYFNGSGTFATSGGGSGMKLFTGTNGSDTYGRSYTAAAARTLLNVADGATNVTNNSQISNGRGYTTNTGTTTPSNTQTFTNKSGNISQWTNDSGYKTTDNNTTYSAGSGITLTGTVFSNAAPNVVQTTVSGNAGSATVLQTARTISGVSFNGSANITLDNKTITNGAGYITSYVNTTYTAGTGLTLVGTQFRNTITNNNQLTNGAGYTTNVGDITNVTAGNGLTGGGASGSVTVSMSGSYSGNFTATGNLTAYSDERLKTNIETIPNALEKVNALRGVSYDKDGERGLGVIAQEVEKVLPELVLDGEEYKSVAYGNMVGVLIEAIKELTKEVEDLKKQIK